MHLLVHVMTTCVFDVGGDIAARRGGFAFDQIGVDQQPRAMAYCGNRLARRREFLREADRIRIDAHAIDVACAARHHKQVEIVGFHIAHQCIGGQRLALITVMLHGFARIHRGSRQGDLRSRIAQITQWTRQFGLLDAPVVDDDQHFAVFHCHMFLLGLHT